MKNEHVIKIAPTLRIFKGIPNMTPYLSVFFILMVLQMVASNFVPISGIHVDLPEAFTSTTAASKRFIVTVDRTGVIYFNDLPLENIDSLKQHVLEIRNSKSNDAEELVIRADATTPLSTTAKLMALAEELNINARFMVSKPQKSVTTFEETE